MKKLVILCFVVAAFGFVAMAQDHPKFELYGGYSFMRYDDSNLPKGFGFSAAGNFHPNVGIVADFSYAKKSWDVPGLSDSYSNYYLMVGPQFSSRSNENVTPFFRALVGMGHQKVVLDAGGSKFHVATVNKLAYGVGGGIDVKIGNNVDLRLIQADYIHQTGDNVSGNIFRLGVGIVFKSK